MEINQIFIHAYRLSQMSIIRSVHWLKIIAYNCQLFFQRTTTIHPGIFLGRALWAGSVSPRTNTIASRDQFKPIRIGENLVVNYKRSCRLEDTNCRCNLSHPKTLIYFCTEYFLVQPHIDGAASMARRLFQN